MIEFDKDTKESTSIASIKVIGVGGAGGNTVNSIISSGYQGIDFIVANTDAQALDLSQAPEKIQLGIKSTKGLGTGANPEIGKRAAEEDLDKVMDLAKNADIVFLTAGMGGGTGSGAVPVIAQALKEKGILTIAVVTKPFLFEGKKRATIAENAIDQIKKAVDTLIVIPNQKLLETVDPTVSMIDAFDKINEIFSQSVKGIADIIARPGHINVDFADVKTIMQERGLAVMGTAKATGPSRAKEAALSAISSPLLENMSIQGAHGVLLNITGGRNLGLHEISEAASVIYDQADENAQIIIGSVIDNDLEDEVSVTIIATGFSRAIKEFPLTQHASPRVITHSEEKVECAESQKEEQDTKEAISTEAQEAKSENNELPVTEQNKEAAKEETTALVDLKDLDVPTFLRKSVEQNKDA